VAEMAEAAITEKRLKFMAPSTIQLACLPFQAVKPT